MGASLLACTATDQVVSRPVTLHLSAACRVPTAGYGVYSASGDYQPATESATQDTRFLSQVGTVLALPQAARMLSVSASDDSNASWLGLAPVAAQGGVDVMLWPAGDSCALSQGTGVLEGGSRSLGAFDQTHALSVGGFSLDQTQPLSYLVDFGRARVTPLAQGPVTVRAKASVTPFSGGALVAGGFRSDDQNGLLDDAEVFDASLSDFDGKPFRLSEPRAGQGAVALSDGRTLLVGGVGKDGVLASLELVGQDRRSVTQGLPRLKFARSAPAVFLLASGEVFVGGGVDGSGVAVGAIELFSPDGQRPTSTGLEIPARAHTAFAPLEGGGALAVIAPDASDPDTFQNVWVMSAAHALSHARLDPVATKLSDPRLYAGPGGTPYLWTGAEWRVYDAWKGTFDVVFDASNDPGPRPGDVLVSPDPGLLAWVQSDGSVAGRRVSTRSAYSTEVLPLLVQGTSLLSPDAPPTAEELFDPSLGLFLPENAAVFLSDARFLDATVDVDVASDGAPSIVLRQANGREVEVGGKDCGWSNISLPATLHVALRNGAIAFGVAPQLAACAASVQAGERVSIGLRGGPARVKNLRVSR